MQIFQIFIPSKLVEKPEEILHYNFDKYYKHHHNFFFNVCGNFLAEHILHFSILYGGGGWRGVEGGGGAKEFAHERSGWLFAGPCGKHAFLNIVKIQKTLEIRENKTILVCGSGG